MKNKLVSMSKEESAINVALYENNKEIFEMIKPHIEQLISLKIMEIREGERHHDTSSDKYSIDAVDCLQDVECAYFK